jgi:two-component system, NtrC family, sensor kinase
MNLGASSAQGDPAMSHDKAARLSWIYDLYQMSQSALSQGALEQVLSEVLQQIARALDAASGSLALIDEENSDRLTIAATVDLPGGAIGNHVQIGEGVMGWVARQGEPLLLTGDVRSDPRFGGVEPREARELRTSASELCGSGLCWPLKVNERITGVLCVNRSRGASAFTDEDLRHGALMVNLVTVVIENARLHLDQQRRIDALSRMNAEALHMNAEILEMNARLEEAQNQLLQSEKMASIGHLAAGVAHEINNPIGFVYSNLGTLDTYLRDIFALVEAYEALEQAPQPDKVAAVHRLKEQMDLPFLRKDIIELMSESRDGITRVKKIVQDLKDFSHQGGDEKWQWALLHDGLDSTLNIASNEIKYKAKVIKEYGEIPEIQCLPSQINQVLMNILVNAAHAIDQSGTITVRTGRRAEEVWVEVTDTGCGIAPDNLKRIFDPFFTTKAVGKGTGLGLSLSYSIVQKHHGRIEVESEVGRGTTFRVCLPVRQAQQAEEPVVGGEP